MEGDPKTRECQSQLSRVHNDRTRLALVAIAFSLALHILFLTYQWRSQLESVSPTASTPIEITTLPNEQLEPSPKQQASKQRPPQIVETEKADNTKVDPNTSFLSQNNQTVEKQMRAQQTDDFRAKQGTGTAKTQSQNTTTPPTGTESKSTESTEKSDLGIDTKATSTGVKRNWKTLSLKDLGIQGDGNAAAATDDYLNDLKSGDRTMLSTKEFKFFSYYQRIKELLRQYWKPNIERQLAMMWGKGKSVTQDEFVTRLLVLLDEKGGIAKISRVESSGVSELDNAAVEAFNRAGPFPNPPKGMIDSDGLVRIRWDFILKTDVGNRIQFQSAGGRVNQ